MATAVIDNNKIIITVPVERVIAGVKEELEEYLNNCLIEVIPIRKLSSEQNGLIHVLLKQYANELGWSLIEMKEYIKEQFALTNDLNYFSTANCDMETANNFIAYIIEHALENQINLYILNRNDKRYKHILEIDGIEQRRIIACLRARVCAICGKQHNEYNTVELHHWKTVASAVGNYDNDDGLQTPFLSLCTQHHSEFHNIGIDDFKDKYIIEGVWLNEQLVYDLLPIYPSHFKLFKKRLKEGHYNVNRTKTSKR